MLLQTLRYNADNLLKAMGVEEQTLEKIRGPIEVFLDSAPHDSFHILFDNMFAVQRDSDALIFTPKPDKTKNGSIYRRSGTPCGQIVQSR